MHRQVFFITSFLAMSFATATVKEADITFVMITASVFLAALVAFITQLVTFIVANFKPAYGRAYMATLLSIATALFLYHYYYDFLPFAFFIHAYLFGTFIKNHVDESVGFMQGFMITLLIYIICSVLMFLVMLILPNNLVEPLKEQLGELLTKFRTN